MPQSQKPSTQISTDEIDRHRAVSEKAQFIIDHLEGNEGWKKAVEDFQAERQRLDDNWQNVSDEKLWLEYRITKLAIIKIINMLDDYKADRKEALRQIHILENPDKNIAKDFDNS